MPRPDSMISPRSRPQRRQRLPDALSFVVLLVLIPLFAFGQQRGSQPDAAADNELPVLELGQAPGIGDGKLAAIAGAVDREGLRIALPDLSVLQPVEVRLAATDPSRPLRLEITKFGYDGVLKSATTDAEGLAVLRFRTQMGAVLGIAAADAGAQGETPFQLVAWVGDELETVPRNVFSPMSDSKSGAGKWRAYAIAGVVLAALIALVLFRRRKRT